MDEQKFGVLTRVDLRILWPHEALAFTPWLAQHLGLLGEALGMDLELTMQESLVGPFSLDLLCRDLGRDRPVIIENQVEQTDHDHLGKLITYAAGHDAAVAIWIASGFREEHRQALDWLNQRTDVGTEFFGVVVEALQIDDSRPACHFRLVAFPNDWRKTKVVQSESVPSSKSLAYKAFFQTVIDRLREDHAFTRAEKAQAQGWYAFTSGMNGISYALAFGMGGTLRAEVYIDREDGTWNEWLFNALAERKAEIEQAFGSPLQWQVLEGKRACRIYTGRAATISDPLESLGEMQGWAIESLLRLKSVFGPRCLALIPTFPSAKVTFPVDETYA